MKKKSTFLFAIVFALVTIFPALLPEKVAASSKYSDGEYTVPFTVLKDGGNEQSTTADYMVSPAKVIIQNNKTYAVVTLKNSSWWQDFKVQGSGGFANVQVLSNNTANETRVVKFEVKDIEQLVNAKIHIIVTGIPGFNYDNKYDIRFKFNSANIPLAPVAQKPAAPPVSKPTPKPTPTPKTTPKETPKPTVTEKAVTTPKPVENKKAVTKVETKTEEKSEEKATESKEVASEKADTKAEEKVAEKAAEEAKPEVSEEDAVAENQEKEESLSSSEKAIDAEVEADSTSKSNSAFVWFIVILGAAILGGAIFFMKKRRTQTQK